MRWEDERYVKLYTRETPDWVALSWEARALFRELMTKVDRAGILPLGKSRWRGVAGVVHMPVDVVERAAVELLDDGCVTERDGLLLLPNFMTAQEAKQSDKARQQKTRETARALAIVTPRDATSQNVTDSHDLSHAVTDGHTASLLAVPNLAVPKEESPANAGPLLSLVPVPIAEPPVKKPARFGDEIQDVYEHWVKARKALKPKSRTPVLDGKRLGAIRGRLAAGHTVEELKLAIDGCFRTPHNIQGDYTDVELICRDETKLDYFMSKSEPPVAVATTHKPAAYQPFQGHK